MGCSGWRSGRRYRTRAGLLTLRGRYRAHRLGTAWLLELKGGDTRGSIQVGVDMWVAVVGDRAAEIGPGRVFDPERQIPSAWARYPLAIGIKGRGL